MTDQDWLLKEKYNGKKTEGFFADLKRLESDEPLAYVIGWVPFLDCKIHLNSNPPLDPPIPSSSRHQEFLSGDRTGEEAKKFASSPLIPRTETEFWTEKAIEKIKHVQNPKVLDLCAGSGAIGVAVAEAVPEAVVHFAELDKQHLSTIGQNLEENDIPCTRYKVWQSDLFENVTEKYDFILTNPPYIDPKLDRTQASVKLHEPHLALYGGADGMELIERIIKDAKSYLNPSGELWIEHEPEQATAIVDLAKENRFKSVSHSDQFNVTRYSVLTQNDCC